MSAVAKLRPGSALEEGVRAALAVREKLVPANVQRFGDARDDRPTRELATRLAKAGVNPGGPPVTDARLGELRRRLDAADDPLSREAIVDFVAHLSRALAEVRTDHGCVHWPPHPREASSFVGGPLDERGTRYSNLLAQCQWFETRPAELIALAVHEVPAESWGRIDKTEEERAVIQHEFDQACLAIRWTLEDTVWEMVDPKRGLGRLVFRWQGAAAPVPVMEDGDGPGDAAKRLVAHVAALKE